MAGLLFQKNFFIYKNEVLWLDLKEPREFVLFLRGEGKAIHVLY